MTAGAIRGSVVSLIDKLNALKNTYDSGKIMRSGVKVAIAVYREVHHSKKRICVHILIFTNLTHRLVAEAEIYAKPAKALQYVIVVGNQRYHLVVGFIHLVIFHRPLNVYLSL